MLQGALLGGSISALASLFLFRRYLQAIHPPSLTYQETTENKQALLDCLALLRPYWPHPFLRLSGLLSTAMSGLRSKPSGKGKEEEVLVLPDGGTVSLVWTHRVGGGKGVVLILPGLNNSSDTPYIQQASHSLHRKGFSTVVLNYRGVGGRPLNSLRVGCADSWLDFPSVLAHIRKRYTSARMFALGFSMGGGMLVRYLGEHAALCAIEAAVAVSAPLNFTYNARFLENGFLQRLVNFAMTLPIKVSMYKQRTWLEKSAAKGVDKWAILRALSLREIEERSICLLHGYKDAEEYYSKNDGGAVLDRVAVPLLIVTSDDDPVVQADLTPMDKVRDNPNVILAVTRSGGHLGWTNKGLSLGPSTWLDSVCTQFLSHHAGQPARLDKPPVPLVQSAL